MTIDTPVQIWIFAILTTICALAGALVLNFALFPSEIIHLTLRGTAVISPAVTMPITLWIGYQMRENAMLGAQLQALVDRDRLTDVATRDFFFARLLAFPKAYGVSLMVDIDHFKRINDTHGHLAGDEVIRTVAHVMRDQIRENDIVCRFGGEEFVVFLCSATPQEGWIIAERIRAAIAAATTQSVDGDIKVTVSVGGSLKEGIERVDAAIARADACLYRAKGQGRNCTVVDWDVADMPVMSGMEAGRPADMAAPPTTALHCDIRPASPTSRGRRDHGVTK